MSWLFASSGQSIGASFSISPSNEYSELISFRIDRFNLLTVQEMLKSFLQHHSVKTLESDKKGSHERGFLKKE